MIVLFAVVLVFCWCFIRWWDRKLDRMEAQARLARLKARQSYTRSNPRSQE